ncbi:MAG: prephenate dehydrogenase [Gemmatimonadetes bacterium]|nr:MAG: prephenate dehydrogenase [Gemmatimonadota bacterium]
MDGARAAAVTSASSPALAGRRVAVVGLGLMGGSLARDLAALPDGPAVVGWDALADTRREARRAGAVDDAPDALDAALTGADVVVLAVPLDALGPVLEDALRAAPDALLLDVTSLQAPALAAWSAVAGQAGEGAFVSAHPWTGAEASGFAASRRGLYEGARVFLTAPDATAAEARDLAAALWRALGARPTWTEADAHDRLMAAASHLPQLAASALADVLREQGISPDDLGPGGRDTTRLAASSEGMWEPLLRAAADLDAPLLRALAERLEGWAAALEHGDTEALGRALARARAWKQGGGAR